jgi:hypothetical protein
MSLDGGTLEPAGSGVSGTQVKGITQQYQLAGTNANLDTSTAITPYDSGNILGHQNPGKTAEKLVSGVIQRSTSLLCNNSPLGNTLPSSNRPTTLGDPLVNTAQTAVAGLSLSPAHE